MSEICDGPIIWIIEKRLWYAPWKKKVLGIRVYGLFIPLTQPEDAIYPQAIMHALKSKNKGKCGSLGWTRVWKVLREDWRTINAALKSYGGDPLPEELMTEEGKLFNFKTGVSSLLDNSDCPDHCRRHPYRIIFSN